MVIMAEYWTKWLVVYSDPHVNDWYSDAIQIMHCSTAELLFTIPNLTCSVFGTPLVPLKIILANIARTYKKVH